MIEVPKLVLILLIAFLVWYAMRWINGSAPKSRPRRPTAGRRQQQQPQRAIEDLVACGKCGAYVAQNAHGCGRADCPQPH